VSLPVFLIAAGLAVAYAVSLWRWPMRPCPRCHGKGTNRGSTGKRYGRCRRCKGTKQVKRIGATAVHRFWWSVAGRMAKDRMAKRVEKAQDKARWPE
jgi:hypothetical protein